MNEADASQVRGCDKTGNISDNTATDSNQRCVPVRAKTD
jgi:hypothetical protein